MASVTLGGNAVTVNGNFLKKGDTAPDFTLTGKDLKEVSLKDYAGKRKVLNIVPSLDTPVCQTSTHRCVTPRRAPRQAPVWSDYESGLMNTVSRVPGESKPKDKEEQSPRQGTKRCKKARLPCGRRALDGAGQASAGSAA